MVPIQNLPCGTPEVYAGVLAKNETQSVVSGKRNGSLAEHDVKYIANNFVRPNEALLLSSPKALLGVQNTDHASGTCSSIDGASPRDYPDKPC